MIKVICVGKIKEDFFKEAIKEYEKRITKYSKIQIIELEDSDIEKEKNLILNKIDKKDYVISLDINGNKLSSLSLANKIDKTLIDYPNICFIIGGSDGLADIIKSNSNYLLSFSDMTFPHQLFRVILLEQIYRSFKIIKNEAYHK